MNNSKNETSIYSGFFAVWFAHFFLDFMLGIWPVYKTVAHLDLSKAGWIAGIGMFIGEGMQLVFGALSDQGYQKKLLLLGLLLVCSAAFLACTDSYLFLFILMVCTYMGSGAFHPAGVRLVSSWTSTQKGAYIAIFASGGMVGEAISQRVFSHTYQLFHGETLIFLLPAFFVIAWCLCLPFSCRAKTPIVEETVKERLLFIFNQGKGIGPLYCLQVLIKSISLSMVFLLPEILSQREFPVWFYLGGGHGFYILGCAIFSIPVGHFSDRIGMMPVLSCALAASATVFGLLFFTPTLSLPLTALLLFAFGASTGVVGPLIVAAGTRLMPAHAHGMVGGILMGASTCLASVSVMMIGVLNPLLGSDAPVKALQAVGVIYFAIFALLYSMSRKKAEQATPAQNLIEMGVSN